MHYYKFHIADYRKDTTHLSFEEHYIYRTLIDWYFLDESEIPNDIQSVTRKIGLCNDRSTTVQQVLTEFFVLHGNSWKHNRIDREIKEYHGLLEVASRAGKASAEKKKLNKINANSTTVQRPFNDRSTNHKPLTINHEPIDISTPIGFDEFYKKYPKKVGRPAALKAYRSQRINGELNTILSDIDNRLDSGSWKDKQFIPNPATYLNQRRWEDDFDCEQGGGILAGAI